MKVIENCKNFPFRAVEVAFSVEKFQFAKTLIEKQTSASKLRATGTDESGSLLHAFAENCKNPLAVDQELLEEVVSNKLFNSNSKTC